jgi:hypothetical protein
MIRTTQASVLTLAILGLAACQGAGGPMPSGLAEADAAKAIDGALHNKLTSSMPGTTEPCDAFFEASSVTVTGGHKDGAVDYEVKVRATYDTRASERAANCYGGLSWKAGQQRTLRRTARFERADSGWRIVDAG